MNGAVENVTAETQDRSGEAITAADDLTRVDNGTVLLLDGTDSADVDWAPDLPVETDTSSGDESEAEAKVESDPTETDSDGDSGGDTSDDYGDDAGGGTGADSGGSLSSAAG